jgi:hypothetical protein
MLTFCPRQAYTCRKLTVELFVSVNHPLPPRTPTDGETGFLVEKNDSGALASATLRLLENDSLRETMGRAGRFRALQHFHFNDMERDVQPLPASVVGRQIWGFGEAKRGVQEQYLAAEQERRGDSCCHRLKQ